MSRVALLFLLAAVQGCGAAPLRPAGGAPGASGEDGVRESTSDGPPSADGSLGPADEEEVSETAPLPVVVAPAQPERAPHPFADLSDDELESMLVNDPTSLGSISLGRTSGGALFNPVTIPPGPYWKIVNRTQTWGTTETVEQLAHCIERVNQQFPNTPPLHIGDISERNGGYIKPHISHQSGRDVDLGYYYTTARGWYVRGNASNLDLARNWALIRAMITETDVQRIFIDRAIQKLLREHALSIGEDSAWLDRIFGGGASTERPLIMHEDGHDTHLHVRFYNPIAQETGRRMYRLLVAHKKISPPTYYIQHKVRRGDTLGRMARTYSTTVEVIKKANGLRSSRIIAGRSYKIPRRGGVTAATSPLVLPPRRLPPQGTHAGDAFASPQP
ncbi:MAG TPA: penicillin-insensitive murein endopeptidase [Kofleriaceae bacterium]|nr:penicillin-insensitive murein endopeptidase [Kofleriaceae bacterium]